MVAIGIDLGTTFSCVAYYDRKSNRVEVIPNDQGDRTTPSVVAFTENERLVGKAAKDNIIVDPKNTLYDVKRLIGRTFKEAQEQMNLLQWPFAISEHSNGGVRIHAHYKGAEKRLAPEEISAMVLEKMKKTAENHTQSEVEGAVITVPAYFSDAQRQATKDAAAIIGLNVLRIINEPTAAAIAYGLNAEDPEERNILVFDLGGGTFDVSILHIEEGIFEVKSTAGDTTLGGEDFTNRLVTHCVTSFPKEERRALIDNHKAIGRLRRECEKAKINLAGATAATIDVPALHQGVDFRTSVTRAKFDDLNRDLYVRIMDTVRTALIDAKLDKSDVNEIIMVGGSSRIVKISHMIQEFFGDGSRINKAINPDEAVSVGAAHQAHKLTGGDACMAMQEYVLIDVAPLSLGIENNKDQMSIIVERNTQNLLGTFTLENLPQLQQLLDVEVSFELDSDGILKVSAVETSQEVSQTVKIIGNKGRLSADDIRKMIEDAEAFRADDEREIERVNMKVELEHNCFKIQGIVKKKELKTLKTTDVLTECNKILQWIDDNPNASAEAFVMKNRMLQKKYEQL